MAYTPPASDAVDLDFTGAYTPPAGDGGDLEIPLTSDEVVDASSFENTTEFSSDVLWYSQLTALENNTELEPPVALLKIYLADFNSTNTIDISTARRVGLLNFESIGALSVEYINEVEAGVTPVAPWPFESVSRLSKPDFAHIIETSFEQDSVFETPMITASGLAIMVPPNFENIADFSLNMMPILVVDNFEIIGQLDILAIRYMPDGDQYTVCPPFEQNSEFEIPIFQTGFVIPDFEQDSDFVVSSIYNGFLVESDPFENTSDLNSGIYPVIVLSDFNLVSALNANITPGISPPDFDQVSTLSAETQTGVFAETPEFNSRISLEMGVSIYLDLPDFEQTSELELFTISEFIAVPDFNISNELLLDQIRLFTIENSQLFYYLVVTGGALFEDIELPFTSIQARRRNGEPTYLSVVIPSFDYAGEINDREANKIQIFMGYKIDSETSIRQLIIETNIDQINIYKGAKSQSIVLIGYETIDYIQKELVLEKPTYSSIVGGKKSFRFAVPKIDLHPGDIAHIGTDSIEVETISMYIKNTKSGPINTTEIASA